MYDNGDGVPQNHDTAIKWYTLAAEQKHSRAQLRLGFMYQKGQGVPQDYKTAVKWFTLAAEQKHSVAQYALGLMYDLGAGVPQDDVYAHMWFNFAASSGVNGAQQHMEKVAERMTPTQIAEAQKLARECVDKEYKGC